MKKLLLLILLLSFFSNLQAQSISGVINRYYKVLEVDRDNGWVRLLASDATLATYKKALLIQMKGASMSTANNSTFGDLTALNNAGNFELANLCGFMSDTVVFENRLNNYYTNGELIQLIPIPEYDNVTITDTLKGLPWNAGLGLGGVIVLEAKDTLFLNKPVDASGIGFEGGALFTFVDCTFGGNVTDYAIPFNNGAILAIQGAKKGEGIVPYITNKEWGRGKQVNGGGGGNHHNAGGGGGANYGAGGGGGNRTVGGCKSNSPGVGGLALKSVYDTCSTRLFLGGGGGSGHGNQNTTFGNTGKPGGNGGGIIIITARVIQNNGAGEINANGARPYDVNTIPIYNAPHDADSDGGGGGGAGGTIVVKCLNYSGNNIPINAEGAKGSNTGLGNISTACDAPGGGGGGGLIVFSTAGIPAIVTANVAAGASGLVLSPPVACHGTPNGASDGTAGNTLFNYAPPAMRDSSPICKQALPVNQLLSFKGQLVNTEIRFTATVLDATKPKQLTLQRSFNGNEYETVVVLGNNSRDEYLFNDVFQFRVVFYRLLVTNKDGRRYSSGILKFSGRPSALHSYAGIHPNPVNKQANLFFNTSKAQPVMISIYDAAGQIVYSLKLQVEAGANTYNISLPDLADGLYYIKFLGETFAGTKQFMKLH